MQFWPPVGLTEFLPKIRIFVINPKFSTMIDFFTHLGAAILFYAVLKNNPKLQKRADALLTMAAVPFNLLKDRITKLFRKND